VEPEAPDSKDTPPELDDKVRRILEQERSQRRAATKAREEADAKIAELEAKLLAIQQPKEPAHSPESASQLAAFQKRIETLETAIRSEQEKRDQAERRLADTRISDALRRAAADIGVVPELIDDVIVLPRVRSPWAVDEAGEPAILDSDGQPRYSTKDPTRKLTAREFLSEALKESRHYFAASAGAGVPGSATGPGRTPPQHYLSREDAKDLNKYRAAKEAAKKAGVELQIEQPAARS